MGDTSNANETADGNEKPAQGDADVVFPPFPEPTQDDFEEDIPSEEREYYKTKFPDLNAIKTLKLHCTACDRHLGCSARNENRMRVHPMLRTLICQTCLTFYNSGEFDKGEDGSELYCRWCGQGGQVYCCSDCPHVFCAKCVKRNLGTKKIKEIEELDDWKCFKCNPRCLWDLRATCWALLRFCDLKNQITYKTQDPELKEKYQLSCIQDYSECCKRKSKVKENSGAIKRESSRAQKDSNTPKTTPTIQVKKFASIHLEDNSKEKIEKKPQKRPASPKVIKTYSVKTPIPIAPNIYNKKMKMAPGTPIRITMEKKPIQTYTPRQRMKAPMVYNGFSAYTVTHDNINLSLESLTQGLDMNAVASMSGNNNMVENDDVVCTPDFPMEPLCEVTEDPGDDDVECITPVPQLASTTRCPPLLSRNVNNLPDLSPGNIIQMTENDVTVNAATGGLKFRVDPQTLSSNKMYRLPDGRIFAINANPAMPGGYSATIVAVTDNVQSAAKVPPRGATYAAKLSAVVTAPSTQLPKTNPRVIRKNTRKNTNSVLNSSKSTSTPKNSKPSKTTEKRSSRPCDLNVPVEWYRFNLIDAVDALEYSLTRLNQLKTQATTMFLRTRTVNEMRSLHKTLDRALATSANRFLEIKDNLNNEFKKYVAKKQNVVSDDEDDDDDVEILPDTNDDPIFIDENSEDSQISNREVDLTAQASSDHDSSGKSIDKTVINDDCVDLDVDKPEKDKSENLKDPLMIEDKNEEIRDGEKSPLNGVDNNDTEEDSQQPKNPETENNERVSNVETTGDSCNANEVSESSDSTNTKTDRKETSINENGSNVLDENTSEDKVTDKEDVQINDEKISDLQKPEKPDDSGKIADNDTQISEEVKEDNETQENDLDDIEMNDSALENNDKMMDDNEMSEKAIEELLKDDNESIDGSVDNHSVEVNNEKS